MSFSLFKSFEAKAYYEKNSTRNMKYKNLEIIGTSHIAIESIKEIENAFESQVDIVAIELDKDRLYSITHPEQKQAGFFALAKSVGFRGALFAVLGKLAQKHLGSAVGVEPGSDMKLAYELAVKKGARVSLIDQPIQITLRKFSNEVTFGEKMRAVWDVIKGVFDQREARELVKDFDLSKVPKKQLIRKLLERIKKRYPNMYKVLVEERNVIMAERISRLMAQNPDKRIIAVVGAGHEEEIIRLIKLTDGHLSFSWSMTTNS